MDAKIRERRPALKKKIIIFHQDNVCFHISVLSMAKFNELKYEYLAYSPDLAPSGYDLFLNLEKFLDGKRFMLHHIADLPESHFNDGIELLEKRWNKCVEVSGEYIKK